MVFSLNISNVYQSRIKHQRLIARHTRAGYVPVCTSSFSSSFVASGVPLPGCFCIDDTSPERSTIGLPPGRVDLKVG